MNNNMSNNMNMNNSNINRNESLNNYTAINVTPNSSKIGDTYNESTYKPPRQDTQDQIQ